MCGGGKDQTTTSSNSQTYTPTGASQLQDIWNKVQNVASTPYQAYNGQLVAGVDPTQTQGIQNVNSAVGTAQPYFDQAAQYATQGAASISPDQIQKYQSPYTQSVINATQANFNEDNAQQQQQLLGNAALSGALGGDRSGVAQAELARQQQLAQAPVIAGLQNQGYTQALGAAQADRAAQAQGAYTFGSLAPAVQNTNIAGGNAQIAAGSVPQQNQQQQLSAQYQQYLNAQAFPYQQAQFLASYGLPAVTAQGGTQTGAGSTTQPGPSPWGQAAGLGLTAAGLFLKDGGRVQGYASGGSPMSAENFILVPSFIPQGQAPQAQTPQMAPMQAPKPSAPQGMGMPSSQSLQSGMAGLGRLYDNLTWDGGTPLEGSLPIGQGGIGHAARGGRVNDSLANTVNSIHRALKDGGAVSPSMGIQGYDIGGLVGSPFSFDELASPAQDAISSGQFDPQGSNYTPFTQSPPLASNIPIPQARPDMTPQSLMASTPVTLPPQITNPDNKPIMMPDDAMAYSGAQPQGLTSPNQPDLAAQNPSQDGKGGLFGTGFLANLSPEAKTGLLTAGLGMMASRSPFALTQIGEGGLQGVQAYTQAKKTAADEALKKQSAELAAQRLAQSAEQFSKEFGLKSQAQKDTAEYHQGLLARSNLQMIGTDAENHPVLMDTRTGKTQVGDQSLTGIGKSGGQVMDDGTADFMAERVLAGDTRALVGLGRGAQGAQNISKIQAIVAAKAKERNIDPTDILNNIAIQSGNTASQRTFGTQTARMAINTTEANGAIELGRQASALVPRGNWVPVTKAIQAFQSGTSDPNLAKFGAANLAIVNTYARAISPTGQPTIHDKEHAEQLLSTATGPDAYRAVLDQMQKEIEIAHGAAPKAKKELEDIRKGRAPAAQASPTPTTTLPARVRQNGHTYERQSDGSMKAVD